MYERANLKRGLEQAIIGQGDYARSPKEDLATAKARRAREIEELLKNGAHQLFSSEHDERVREFSAESIDQILER